MAIPFEQPTRQETDDNYEVRQETDENYEVLYQLLQQLYEIVRQILLRQRRRRPGNRFPIPVPEPRSK
jgi:hypothetical protein